MKRKASVLAAGLLVLTMAIRVAIANPQGPSVVHGQASFGHPAPDVLQITNSPNTIINWQGFSIGAHETTRFVQESAASAVLNRVVGSDPSSILGRLESNGRVFLVNPQGIYFGPGAVVDVGGLVASTLRMTDADFLAGRHHFEAGPGAAGIRNQGLLRSAPGGEVVLIAPDIENSGIIQADNGQVLLAAGRSVTLASLDASGIAFEVQAPEDRVLNLGELIADGGAIGVFAGTLRNRGRIRADSIGIDANGEVVLSATHSATLEAGSSVRAGGASGGTIRVESAAGSVRVEGSVEARATAGVGGDVRLLGEELVVADGALVDASGRDGGGRVLLGGSRRDQAPIEALEAAHVRVEAESRVAADALVAGDGGEVVVWGRESAVVAGRLSARGGPEGGDGGFVETSAGGHLLVLRGPAVNAPAGKGGTWLLDPDTIRIVAGDGSTANLGAPLFTSTDSESVIGATLINEQLDFGSSIIITTSGFGAGTGAGDIFVDAALLKTIETGGTTGLELLAHRHVVVNAPIGSTGAPLRVELHADILEPDGVGAVTVNAPITTAGGAFEASAGGAITLAAAVDTRREAGFAGSVFLNAGGEVALVGAGTVHAGTNGASASASVSTGAGQRLRLDAGTRIDARSIEVFTDDVLLGGHLASASGGVSFFTRTAARPVSIGVEAAGSLGLSAAELSRVSTLTTLTIGSTFGTGPVTVGGAVSFTGVQNLTLSGASFTQAAGAALSVPGTLIVNAGASATVGSTLGAGSSLSLTTGDLAVPGTLSAGAGGITVRANTLDLTGAITTGASGGNIQLEPNNFRNIDLGGPDVAGTTLGISAAEVNRVTTTGRLQLGGPFTTGTINVTTPVAPAGVGTLVLRANGNVTQTAGSTLGVGALAVTSFGSVSLPEANQIGTVAGSAGFGSAFLVSNAMPLAVGSAGGFTGLTASSGTVTVEADNLSLAANVFAGTAILRPRSDVTTVDLGGPDAAGVLGLTDAELDRVLATELRILGDSMDVSAPVIWLNGSRLVLAPLTAGELVSLGVKVPDTLGFTQAELQSVSTGVFATLVLGSAEAGNLTTEAAFTRSGNLELVSGGGVTIEHALEVNSELLVRADSLAVDPSLGSLSADTVTLAPLTAGTDIDLGGGLGAGLVLDAVTVNERIFTDRLVIGSATAGAVAVTDAVVPTTAFDLAILGQSFSQAALSNLTVTGALEIETAGTLTVDEALSATGLVSLSANDLVVDAPVSGEGVRIRAQSAAINDSVDAGAGPLEIAPRSFRSVTLGTNPLGVLALDAAELALLATTGSVRIGDQSTTNQINITAPIAPGPGTLSLLASGNINQMAGSTVGVDNLRLSTFSSVNLPEANPVTRVAGFASGAFAFGIGAATLEIGAVDGAFGVFGGTSASLTADGFTFTSPVSSSNVILKARSAGQMLDVAGFGVGAVSANGLSVLADRIDVSGPVNLSASSLVLAPRTIGQVVNVEVGAKPGDRLGLLASELNDISLAFGGTVTVGSADAGDLEVTAPSAITAFNHLALVSGVDLAVNAALSAPVSLRLAADDVSVSDALTSPTVTIEPLSFGQGVVVDPSVANQITATNLTFGSAGSGPLTLAGALAPAGVSNLTLLGSAITLGAGETISVPGALTLRADDMALGAAYGSTGGGAVTLAPRALNRQMDLGTKTAGRLGLTAAEIGLASTSGTLRLGDTAVSGAITVSAPLAAPGTGSLALLSRFGIAQSAGATISAARLRASSSFGPVTLNEANQVSTVAGSASGSFSLRSAAPLTVGIVDGISGISDGAITLTADVLQIANTISGSTVTLIPATAGRPILLGAESAAALSLTDAELGRVSASTLNIGSSTAGPITVAAPVHPTGAFNLNLVAAGGTVNVNAALTVPGNLTMQSDTINIGAPVTTELGSIQLRPLTPGRPIQLGAKGAGVLGLTSAEIDLLSLLGLFGTLTIGAADAGPISVVAPVAPAGADTLRLSSGAGITQTALGIIEVPTLWLTAGGTVDLRADNLVTSLSASVSGIDNDLFFHNREPLRLQDIFVSNPTGGRIEITTSRLAAAPPVDVADLLLTFLNIEDLLLALRDGEDLDEEARRLREGEEDDETAEIGVCS